MIVWGGQDVNSVLLDTGGRYYPFTDSWIATITATERRDSHTAVWTGSEMIVCGGFTVYFLSRLNTGGRYNPITDSWIATSLVNAPTARGYHTAVWTGSEMIVWGGDGESSYLNTGGRYNPGTNTWFATTITNAPFGRRLHTAVWTVSEMIICRGEDENHFPLNTGGR